MLLVIDNQSTLIKSFKRNFLEKQDFDYIFFDHNQQLNLPEKTKIDGIILTGGKGNPYEPLNLTADFVALNNFNVPIIGFCLGHEIIAVAFGGKIKKLAEYNDKDETISILKPKDPIFKDITSPTVTLIKRHSFFVSEMPTTFECLASSDTCDYEVIKHKTKPIYGFQAHPEASGEEGMKIIHNFLRICGLIK